METRKEILENMYQRYERLSSITSSLEAWIHVLNKQRKRAGGVLTDTDIIGKTHPVLVGDILDRIDKLCSNSNRELEDLLHYLVKEYKPKRYGRED